MNARQWRPILLAFPLITQAKPSGVEAKPVQGLVVDTQQVLAPFAKVQPLDKQIDDLRGKKNWTALRELLEGLPPKERGPRLAILIETLGHLEQWEALVQVADETLAIAEKKTGPRTCELRIVRAVALSKADRHIEASKAHLEHAYLGWKPGFRLACDEARVASDWTLLKDSAEAGISMLPDDVNFPEIKGEALTKLGLYAEGAATLTEVVKKAPTDAVAWLNLSCCRNEIRAYQEAQDAADQLINLDPQGIGGFYNRARARLGLKHYREAREDFAAALSTDPKDPGLRKNIEDTIKGIDLFLARPEPAAKPARRKS